MAINTHCVLGIFILRGRKVINLWLSEFMVESD